MLTFTGRFGTLTIQGKDPDSALTRILQMAINTPYSEGTCITAYPFAHVKDLETRGIGVWADDDVFNTNILPVDLGCGVMLAAYEGEIPTEELLHDSLIEVMGETGLQAYIENSELFMGIDASKFPSLEVHFVEIGKALDGSIKIAIHAGSGALGWAAKLAYSKPQMKPATKETYAAMKDAEEIQRICKYYRAAVLKALSAKLNAQIKVEVDTVHNSAWMGPEFGMYRGATHTNKNEEALILLGAEHGIARIQALTPSNWATTFSPTVPAKLGIKNKDGEEFADILEAELNDIRASEKCKVVDLVKPLVTAKPW